MGYYAAGGYYSAGGWGWLKKAAKFVANPLVFNPIAKKVEGYLEPAGRALGLGKQIDLWNETRSMVEGYSGAFSGGVPSGAGAAAAVDQSQEGTPGHAAWGAARRRRGRPVFRRTRRSRRY